MKDFFDKLKIPTLLGLGIIILGIGAGVFLTLKEQIFISKAFPNVSPQNIILTNLSDSEVTISWQTSTPIPSFITYGQTNPSEATMLDDRDTKSPQAYSIHYVTLKNLLPKTTYQYKIISGKIPSEISRFTTATPISNQTGFRPIIGSVLKEDKPLDEGVVYLSIADAAIQSGIIKSSGNFLIPTSQIRKSDMSQEFPLTEDTIVKLTVVSSNGQSNVIFRLKDFSEGLPPITLGQDLDLTDITPLVSPSQQDLEKYDLNGDGKLNAADNSIILGNFGNPSTSSGLKNRKADLNGDGIVNQKDLDLMAQKIKDLGSQ